MGAIAFGSPFPLDKKCLPARVYSCDSLPNARCRPASPSWVVSEAFSHPWHPHCAHLMCRVDARAAEVQELLRATVSMRCAIAFARLLVDLKPLH